MKDLYYDSELGPESEARIVENWLTRKPSEHSFFVASAGVFLLTLGTFFFWENYNNWGSLMPVISSSILKSHEYWRLWTALFAHADFLHLLSNSILFFAFSYLLFGHFGSIIFPVGAFLFGGITNAVVALTLPPEVQLLGASGMVYWMGATWLTLYLCLDTRDRFSRRVLKVLGVGAILFTPETFQPHVSYLSHLIGFMSGIAFALAYFQINQDNFRKAEIIQYPGRLGY